ncbi:hypothetical protein [Kutzneria albida]|uniref:Uncharacterized protein n=1 Tax=Kutzneria albida DSM 43870 TaxID=1449976 RepID=W5W727_9PSEU|nr:hypothetical protein [Kutzneria albida]AHH96336.1 hypothetical protein KALB_2968 [Kutzneria albida DSM 43870]
MLGELVAALAAARVQLSGEELADALWLAGHLDRSEPAGPGEPPARQQEPRPEQPAESEAEPGTGAGRREPTGSGAGRPAPGASQVPGSSAAVHLPGREAGDRVSGLRLLSPAAPAVPEKLGLSRALRPLKRRVPDARSLVVDEDATAARIADTGCGCPSAHRR